MEPDLEQQIKHERTKREESDKHYHELLAERDEKTDRMAEEIKAIQKKLDTLIKKDAVQENTIRTQQDMIKDLDMELKKVKDQNMSHQKNYKEDQQRLDAKDKELQAMMKKKQEFFQDKKKVQGELADSRATNQGLHETVDQLRKVNAEKDQIIERQVVTIGEYSNIATTLEETFKHIPSENLSTPEFVEKIREYENRPKRTDSRTSVSSEKRTGPSVDEELAEVDTDNDPDLWGEEPSEDEEGDRTLTEGFEMAEMKQKVEKLEGELDASKAKEDVFVDRISELQRELAAEKKRAEEKEEALKAAEKKAKESKKPAQQLGFSSISAVETTPSLPSPAPAQPELGFSSIVSVDTAPVPAPVPAPSPPTVVTVVAKPTARDFWEQLPAWVFFLLVLCAASCGYLVWSAAAERALWLGANDVVRASAVRLAVRRREAYCAAPGGQLDGVLAPLWLAVQGWLGLPMPRMLS